MPLLDNPRHERFVQALFEGKPANKAYEEAGYKPHDGNCIRLRGNERVQARLAELQQAAQKKSEVTVASLLEELETARVKATDLNQLSAAVRATAEKAKISGLLIQRIEVGRPNEFEDLNSTAEIISRLKILVGHEPAELLCAFFGVDENGAKTVKSGSSAPFRRKFGRCKARLADESLIRDAIGPHVDVEILPEDVAQLRELMRQFDDLVDGVKARSAKLVSPIDPAAIERKRFFGNGRSR
jgi:Terminase small subunit